MQLLLPVLAVLPSVALAQYGAAGGSSSTSTKAAAAVASSTSSASGSAQTVVVGKGGFTFSPDSVVATPGQQVVFMFAGGFHSATQGAFDTPCQPLSGTTGINSGFVDARTAPATDVFTVTINSTDPMYIYCAQSVHCQSGMVMTINGPSGGNTLDAYRTAAKTAGNSTKPATIQGGILAAPANSSSSASGSSSGSGSSTASATASSTAKSEGLTTKLSFASMLVGAAAVLALVI